MVPSISHQTRRHSPFRVMAHVVQRLDQPSNYKDSQSRVDRGKQQDFLSKSSTLYVSHYSSDPYQAHQPSQIGNLSFYTTEEQIYELFSKCTSPEDGGGIKRIIMGLDRNTRCSLNTPQSLRTLLTSLKNTVWVLLRGVLYTCGGTCMHEVYQWYKT